VGIKQSIEICVVVSIVLCWRWVLGTTRLFRAWWWTLQTVSAQRQINCRRGLRRSFVDSVSGNPWHFPGTFCSRLNAVFLRSACPVFRRWLAQSVNAALVCPNGVAEKILLAFWWLGVDIACTCLERHRRCRFTANITPCAADNVEKHGNA